MQIQMTVKKIEASGKGLYAHLQPNTDYWAMLGYEEIVVLPIERDLKVYPGDVFNVTFEKAE